VAHHNTDVKIIKLEF